MFVFDTIYYMCIGAVMLCMILFNTRSSILRKNFHSLLKYDLRVDMFVNENETENNFKPEMNALVVSNENETSNKKINLLQITRKQPELFLNCERKDDCFNPDEISDRKEIFREIYTRFVTNNLMDQVALKNFIYLSEDENHVQNNLECS